MSDTAVPDRIGRSLGDLAGVSQKMSKLQIPDIPPSPLVTNVTENYASKFYERLSRWINNFHKSLDEQHEVGVRLVTFGRAITFHLENIGYWNPSLISFSGETEVGEPVELIQHVSQISILLMKLPRRDLEEPKRPIGFSPEPFEGEEPQTGVEDD